MLNYQGVCDMNTAVDLETETEEEEAAGRRLNNIILTLNIISAVGLIAVFVTHWLTGA